MIESLGLLARFVAYAGVFTIVGAVAFRLLVLKRVGVGVSTSARASRRAARLAKAACVFVGIAAMVRLGLQTAEMRFPTDSWLEVGGQMLFGTSWGTVWMIQVACCVLLAMSFTLARKDALPRWRTSAVLSIVLAASSAFSSHAMSARRFGQYAVASDALHILAASIWIGTLFVMTASVLRGDGNDPESELSLNDQRGRYIGLLLRAYSPVAQVSVAIVLVSGVVSSLSHLERIGDLFATPYGQALLRKLVFVVVVLLLGFRNWRFVTPRLAAEGPRRMTRGMAAELVVAVVVLLLTSALVVTPPPGG